jgi:hypothetical protein
MGPMSHCHGGHTRLLITTSSRFRVCYVVGFLLTSAASVVVAHGLADLLLGRHPTPMASTAWTVVVIAVILAIRLATDLRVRRIRCEFDRCGVEVSRVGRRAHIDWEHVESVILRTRPRFPHFESVDFVLAPDTTSARTLGRLASIQISGSNATLDSVARHIRDLRPDLAQQRSRA